MDPLISASRGTLAGDLLWLGTFGFILAIITGANPQPCNRGSEAMPFGTTGCAGLGPGDFSSPHLFGKQSDHS
jgi:hypothetical protein